jgi:hypothetical protein
MSVDVAFLHTSPVHVETFERLVQEEAPGTTTRHAVAEELLRDAQATSADDPALVARVQRAMVEAAGDGAAVVVCTCSTLGAAAERMRAGERFVAMRVDRPMADRAVGSGSRLRIVAALASTLAPTQRLLLESAEALGRTVTIDSMLVTDAWRHFERGERDAYLACIAAAVRRAATDVDALILAQASMAEAGDDLANLGVPVISSPRLGVQAAIRAVRRR